MSATYQHPQPLNLPHGSVRATMSLILSFTLWYLVLTGGNPPTALTDATLLVVIFYFSARMGTLLDAPATTGNQPLYLPRGSIRLFLFLGFLGVAAFMFYQSRPLPETLSKIVSVLEGYAFGLILTRFVHRWRGNKPESGLLLFRHGKAAIVLVITASFCLMFVFGRPPWVPSYAENLLGPLVAFYFGSRPGVLEEEENKNKSYLELSTLPSHCMAVSRTLESSKIIEVDHLTSWDMLAHGGKRSWPPLEADVSGMS